MPEIAIPYIRAVFLNRRDASRYRDLEALLLGLESILETLKFSKFSINKISIVEFKSND